jgi:hypothetical protein
MHASGELDAWQLNLRRILRMAEVAEGDCQPENSYCNVFHGAILL